MNAGTQSAQTHAREARWRSQAEAARVASGVYARKEQRSDLRQQLLVGEGLPCLGVLGLHEQIRKGPRLQLGDLHVLQQIPDDGLHLR